MHKEKRECHHQPHLEVNRPVPVLVEHSEYLFHKVDRIPFRQNHGVHLQDLLLAEQSPGTILLETSGGQLRVRATSLDLLPVPLLDLLLVVPSVGVQKLYVLPTSDQSGIIQQFDVDLVSPTQLLFFFLTFFFSTVLTRLRASSFVIYILRPTLGRTTPPSRRRTRQTTSGVLPTRGIDSDRSSRDEKCHFFSVRYSHTLCRGFLLLDI